MRRPSGGESVEGGNRRHRDIRMHLGAAPLVERDRCFGYQTGLAGIALALHTPRMICSISMQVSCLEDLCTQEQCEAQGYPRGAWPAQLSEG